MSPRLLLAVALATAGCTNAADPRPPVGPDPVPSASYCDWRAGRWSQPDCRVITYQGVYGQDARYVCPQSDGTEWNLRTYVLATGGTDTVAERYVPSVPGSGTPPRMLCVASPSYGGPILFQDDAAICQQSPEACH